MIKMLASGWLCLAAGAVCAAAPGSNGGVPFEFVKHQILLQVRIAGQGPYSCTVDTGANPSVIDLAVANDLFLSVGKVAQKAEGIGTDEVLIYSTKFDVRVGELPSATVDAVALDLSPLAKAFGRPIHCILGQSWLDQRIIQIDYPSRVLRFGKEASVPAAKLECAASEMVFWMPDDLMPLVTAQVNGVEIPVSLDTGSSSTLKLFPDGAAKAGVRAEGSSGRLIAGARGKASVNDVKIKSLKLGPLRAEALQGSIGERNQGESPGRMGNLGNAFLRQGVLILDYEARRLQICARH